MQYPQTAYTDTLQSGITSVALSMTVTTAAPTRTQGILTLGREQGNREDVYYTSVAGNVTTINLRGLSQTALTLTEVAGNKKVHVANEGVEMTTHHNYATNFARLDETQTISGTNTFSGNNNAFTGTGNSFTNAPKVPGLLDPSGNEAIDTPATASAVNQLKVQNSSVGNPVILTTAGADTDIDLELQAKGAGIIIVKDGAQTKTNAAPVDDKDLVNKKYVDDAASFTPGDYQEGSPIYAASSAGSDSYVIALSPVLASYTDGQRLWVKVDVGNTGAATLNAGPGAKSIVKGISTALATGDFIAGATYGVEYSTANDNFSVFTPIAGFSLGSNNFTAKGDLLSASAANTPLAVTVGANNTLLMADSTAPSGLSYAVRPQVFVGSFTRTAVESTGNEVITGVGFTARLIEVTFAYTSTANAAITGFGMATAVGTQGGSYFYADNANPATGGATMVRMIAGPGGAVGYWSGDLSAIGSDGFTIAFVKSNTPGDITVVFKCLS